MNQKRSISRDIWAGCITQLVTFADRQRAAPLSIKATLCSSTPTEHVTSVTCEVDNIIEVELAAIGSPVGWVAGVTTGDSWGSRADNDEWPEVEGLLHVSSLLWYHWLNKLQQLYSRTQTGVVPDQRWSCWQILTDVPIRRYPNMHW